MIDTATAVIATAESLKLVHANLLGLLPEKM